MNYFIEKVNTKLYKTSEVDLTSISTGFIKLLHFLVFQYFLSSKSLPGHIHRLIEIIPKMRKN